MYYNGFILDEWNGKILIFKLDTVPIRQYLFIRIDIPICILEIIIYC